MSNWPNLGDVIMTPREQIETDRGEKVFSLLPCNGALIDSALYPDLFAKRGGVPKDPYWSSSLQYFKVWDTPEKGDLLRSRPQVTGDLWRYGNALIEELDGNKVANLTEATSRGTEYGYYTAGGGTWRQMYFDGWFRYEGARDTGYPEMFLALTNDVFFNPIYDNYALMRMLAFDAGELVIYQNDPGTLNNTIDRTGFIPEIGRFYHYAVESYSRSTSVYVDGEVVLTIPWSGQVASIAGSYLQIGNVLRFNASDPPFVNAKVYFGGGQTSELIRHEGNSFTPTPMPLMGQGALAYAPNLTDLTDVAPYRVVADK